MRITMAKPSRNLSILASMLVKHVERGHHTDGFFLDLTILDPFFVSRGLKKYPLSAPLRRRSGIQKAAILRLADERLKKKKIDRIKQDRKIAEELAARLKPFMYDIKPKAYRQSYY
jgi:hypothetical protein